MATVVTAPTMPSASQMTAALVRSASEPYLNALQTRGANIASMAQLQQQLMMAREAQAMQEKISTADRASREKLAEAAEKGATHRLERQLATDLEKQLRANVHDKDMAKFEHDFRDRFADKEIAARKAELGERFKHEDEMQIRDLWQKKELTLEQMRQMAYEAMSERNLKRQLQESSQENQQLLQNRMIEAEKFLTGMNIQSREYITGMQVGAERDMQTERLSNAREMQKAGFSQEVTMSDKAQQDRVAMLRETDKVRQDQEQRAKVAADVQQADAYRQQIAKIGGVVPKTDNLEALARAAGQSEANATDGVWVNAHIRDIQEIPEYRGLQPWQIENFSPNELRALREATQKQVDQLQAMKGPLGQHYGTLGRQHGVQIANLQNEIYGASSLIRTPEAKGEMMKMAETLNPQFFASLGVSDPALMAKLKAGQYSTTPLKPAEKAAGFVDLSALNPEQQSNLSLGLSTVGAQLGDPKVIANMPHVMSDLGRAAPLLQANIARLKELEDASTVLESDPKNPYAPVYSQNKQSAIRPGSGRMPFANAGGTGMSSNIFLTGNDPRTASYTTGRSLYDDTAVGTSAPAPATPYNVGTGTGAAPAAAGAGTTTKAEGAAAATPATPLPAFDTADTRGVFGKLTGGMQDFVDLAKRERIGGTMIRAAGPVFSFMGTKLADTVRDPVATFFGPDTAPWAHVDPKNVWDPITFPKENWVESYWKEKMGMTPSLSRHLAEKEGAAIRARGVPAATPGTPAATPMAPVGPMYGPELPPPEHMGYDLPVVPGYGPMAFGNPQVMAPIPAGGTIPLSASFNTPGMSYAPVPMPSETMDFPRMGFYPPLPGSTNQQMLMMPRTVTLPPMPGVYTNRSPSLYPLPGVYQEPTLIPAGYTGQLNY